MEQELPILEQQKQELEAQLSGVLTDAEQIRQASEDYKRVSAALDEKELRWLELSELNS